MVDFLSPLAISFMAALSGAAVPGPVFVVTVSESLKKGPAAGPLIVLGHLLLEALIIAAVFLGLDVALSSNVAKMWIAYLGGTILIIMGAYLIKTAKDFKMDPKSSSGTYLVSHGLIASGVISSCSNPHFFLWWLTSGLLSMQYSLEVAGVIGFIAFLIGHAAADLSWFSFIGYSVHKGKKVLNVKAIKLIIFFSALFLIVFGFSYIQFAYFSR